MASDLFETLQERLTKERAIAAKANRNIEDLEVALAALAGKRSASVAPKAEAASPGKQKRGEVMRVALDCIKAGDGTTYAIRKACETQGVAITSNSVSNVIQRLQAKALIRWDPRAKRYAIRDSDDVELSGSERLRINLSDSLNAEDSKVLTLESSGSNGVTGLHPPTTALQAANT